MVLHFIRSSLANGESWGYIPNSMFALYPRLAMGVFDLVSTEVQDLQVVSSSASGGPQDGFHFQLATHLTM